MAKNVWDSLQVETAMCLWDSLNDAWITHTQEGIANNDAPQWVHDLVNAFDGHGTLGMMHAVRHLAFEVEDLWRKLNTEIVIFDWEFIPEVLTHVDWTAIDHHQIAKLKPGTEDKMQDWLATETERQKRVNWRTQVRAECQKLWAYPQLLDDCEDLAEAAHTNNEDPKAFAKWLGEKYDLIPVERW